MSSIPVRNAETPAGVLDFHDSRFGEFDADLAGAKNAEFETWVPLAGDPVGSGAGAVPIDLSAKGGGSGDEDGGDDSSVDSDDED